MPFLLENSSNKSEVVKKPKDAFRVDPNMVDYEAERTQFSWETASKEIDWFMNGKINAAYNAIDRHCNTALKHKIALRWIDDDLNCENYSFDELRKSTNKFANLLKTLKIEKQERVFIFMPRVPELYTAFLGIVKAGSVASTLFAAFGPDGIRDRLKDGGATALITIPEYLDRIDLIIDDLPNLKHVIVVDNRSKLTEVNIGETLRARIRSYETIVQNESDEFNAESMSPTDYSIMLYTSGTTGKAKGIMHCHQAIIQQHVTAKWILDLKEDDIYWCTADPGWVTGIAYGIFGCWSNGATSIVYGGRFDPKTWYQIIDDQKVTVWYTAPTAIRMLMQHGSELTSEFNLSSLRHLLSVGEPLNPEAIRWGLDAFGLPFHDTWWQTETGAMLISNYACLPIKIGSMGKPFPGITAAIVDEEGNILPAGVPGNLAIRPPWLSMMPTIWKNKEKYSEYFSNGWYLSGDKSYMDEDGYFWFIGRADDVIKTSGERVGPFEVESALVEHPAVAEAGVIGKPDMLRGEIIKAFTVLNEGFMASENLKNEITKYVKTKLAGHAYPRELEFVDNLPKTQSGKIMRRVLKARELGLPVGDLSTIERD